MGRLKKLALAIGLIGFGLWLNNSSMLVSVPEDQRPEIIAHRGVHQIYGGTARDANTCRAREIIAAEHRFIENTIPSMQAAFASGAAVVELDVHLTPNGHFAVFHDWELDCQTNGTGVTHKQPMAELRKLDLGYNFTSDGGQTFPLRGGDVGPMPTLTDVLDAELGGLLLINFKSRRESEGKALASLLNASTHRKQVFGVYGGGPPTQAAIVGIDGMRGFDRASLKSCLLNYMALGWSGFMPPACNDMIVAVPMNIGPFLWGWPHRFTKRMNATGSDVILTGAYDGAFTTGIDDAATLAKVATRFGGYIWTNKAEVIGPMLAAGAP